jgi:DNA-binding response OmpR family regulator
MARILIAEDELNMRIGLRDNLEFESYEVDLAEDGVIAMEKISTNEYDLILLDIMMPKKSGFDVCRETRALNIQTPIIFLTAKGEEIDKVLGLELGADDYIIKPFGLRELLARIKAVLRRSGSSNDGSTGGKVEVGRLIVDFDHLEAFEGENQIKVSHKEFEVLQYLVNHPNEVVDRHQLLEKVWGYESNPTTRTVDNFIVRLRQKIELNPNEPKIIITVHGAGYKYIQK